MNLTWIGVLRKVYLKNHLDLQEVKEHQIFRFTYVCFEL